MPRSRVSSLWLLAFALALASPAAAQSIAMPGLPWNSSDADVQKYLTSHGYQAQPQLESGISEGAAVSHPFTDANGTTLFAHEVRGKLVGIVSRHEIPLGSARYYRDLLADSLQTIFGAPFSRDSLEYEWHRDSEVLTVSAYDDGEGHTYLSVAQKGPRYEEFLQEFAKRYAAMLSPFGGLSERWRVAYTDDHQRIAVTKKPISINGRQIRTWVQWDYAEVQHFSSRYHTVEFDYNSMLSQMEYDCNGLRSRAYNDTYRLNGKVQQSSSESTPTNWSLIQPETLGEAIVTVVCNPRP